MESVFCVVMDGKLEERCLEETEDFGGLLYRWMSIVEEKNHDRRTLIQSEKSEQ
jgi:hypothetical protein